MNGVTHVDIDRHKLYPQPGFRATQDTSGKWKGVRIYRCDARDVVELSPKQGTPCTRVGFEFMGFEFAEVEDLTAAMSQITCHYVGTVLEATFDEETGAPTEETQIVTELVLGSAQEALESHERYDKLSESEWEAYADLKAGKLKVVTTGTGESAVTKYVRKDEEGENLEIEMSPAGKEIISKWLKGRDTVLTGSGHTWSVKLVSKNRLTSAQMARFNTIVNPPGNPPKLGTDVDWLFNGATQTEEGSALNITINFLASGPGGWDPDHYKHDAEPPA